MQAQACSIISQTCCPSLLWPSSFCQREGSAEQVFPAPVAGAGRRPQWPALQRGRPMRRGELERGGAGAGAASTLLAPSEGASSDKGAALVTNLRIKGLATGRPLRLEGVRLHFGVYIHHRALVVKCSCIHAVLETQSMMRAFGCDLYSFIF